MSQEDRDHEAHEDQDGPSQPEDPQEPSPEHAQVRPDEADGPTGDALQDEASGGEEGPAETQGSGDPGEDEFGFTREPVVDPDDFTVLERALRLQQDPEAVTSRGLSEEEERRAKPFRLLFHLSAITGALLTLMAAILHFAASPVRGLETIYVFIATGLVLLAVYSLPLARFPEKTPRGSSDHIARVNAYRKIYLRAFGIAFAIGFVVLVLLEFVALLVGVGAMRLPTTSLLLAQHFVLVPVVVVSVLIGALYLRMHVPSRVEAEPLEGILVAVFTGTFVFSATLALFFALGIPAVVQYTGVEPRQAVYIAGVGLACAIAIANLRLRIPNVVRIIQEEVDLSKQVDRSAAQDMQKSMMRNYVLALVFFFGCIGFLGVWLAGYVKPGGAVSPDVALIVLLGLGALFLGVIGVNYVQARQIGSRLILNDSGKAGPGKKRHSPEQVTRYTVMAIGGGIAFLMLIFMLLVATGTLTRIGPLPLDPSYGTDFFVFAILASLGPFGYLWAREAARIRTIDEKFPDFLRDLAESQRAGMTLPRALLTAAQGAYGPLTKEIKIMASQVEWGVSFNEALQRFSERTRTPLIERTVSLVCEAASSGGNVVDILAAASDDAREIKNILMERKQQMGVYSMIIYIAFGVFLTVIGVLNSQFIPELAAAAGEAAGEQVGGLRFGNIDVPTYQRIFWHAAIVQGIGGGLVAGVMTDGHPLSGLRHSVIMTLVAYVVFRFFIM
jgi:archaeal flagellar protein FlaJ